MNCEVVIAKNYNFTTQFFRDYLTTRGRSRQEYSDAFNKTAVDRMCAFMSQKYHGMWESDACSGSDRHKESFRCYQGSPDADMDKFETL